MYELRLNYFKDKLLLPKDEKNLEKRNLELFIINVIDVNNLAENWYKLLGVKNE